MSEKSFTKQELLDMTRTGIQKYFSNSHDSEAAKEIVRQMTREWQGTHDLYRDLTTAAWSAIGRRYGDKVLYETLEETIGLCLKPLLEKLIKSDRRSIVEGMAAAMRGHLGAFSKIEEDEEKFTFQMPCPSGGELITEGRYEPPYNFLKISDPQLMTFGRKDFPVYCAHCYFQDVLPIDWFGEPIWLTEPAQNLGKEPCTRYLYKNAKDIPEKFYERLGRKPKK